MRNLVRSVERFFDNHWKVPGFKKIATGLYWLREMIWDKDHIINIKNTGDYSWGYLDSDSKLLLAMMKIFCEFMAEEYPGYIDWDHETAEIEHWGEDIAGFNKYKQDAVDRHNAMKDLYSWWTAERPANQKLCGDMVDVVYSTFSFAAGTNINHQFDAIRADVDLNLISELHALLEDEMYLQETRMLKLLIEVRGSLWT